MTIKFSVQGIPKSTQTGSIVTVGGRSFPLRRNAPWSALCGMTARAHAPAKPLTGPLKVSLVFWMPEPKRPKCEEPITKPDLENMSKGILDSFNGVLWKDDSQIVDLHLRKWYTTAMPGIDVEVTPC